MNEKIEYTVGCGNVYQDLGMPKPTECLMKSMIVSKIQRLMTRHRITNKQLGIIINLPEESVSDFIRGRFHKFTVDEIIGFHYDLQDEIMHKKKLLRREREAKDGSSL